MTYRVSAGKRDQIEIFFKKKFLSKIDVDLIIWSRTFIISKKIFLSIWSLFPALTPYDLEKEIHHILQDSSKIRDYNAKLRSEYMKLNDEFRRLKVENSKLIFQNTCTEISLAKFKADNFAKIEEVKSLQSVINLLAPGYSDKNNQSDDGRSLLQVNAPDSHVKSSPIGALHGEKNNEPEDSFIKGNTSNSPIQRQKDNSVNLETIFPEPIIPATSSNEISLGGDRYRQIIIINAHLLDNTFSIDRNYMVHCCEKAMEW